MSSNTNRTDTHELFFELVQVALGKREELSHTPTDKEWRGLFEISQRQTVAGVAFMALDKLSQVGQKPPVDLLFGWIGLSEQIRQQNSLLNKRCKQLERKLDELGHKSSILKGQGIAHYYDDSLKDYRQPGDIDVYVGCNLHGAIDIANKLGEQDLDWDYKHLHLNVFKDTEVEMHYRVEVLLNLWKNRKLQKWFREHQDAIFNANDNLDLNSNTNRTNDTNRFVTPTVEFNVFYILLHIYRHFLYEGVGLRQIVDYYFVLNKFYLSRIRELENCPNLPDSYAVKAVEEFGMEKFAKGLMWVMQKALGMSREWMLWEPDEKEGRYILKQVMTGGNFGHHDKRLKHSGGKLGAVKAILTHNMHLLTHYPSNVIWAPVWIVWHKCWKIFHA